MTKKTISIRISPEILDMVTAAARLEGLSRSTYIERVLRSRILKGANNGEE